MINKINRFFFSIVLLTFFSCNKDLEKEELSPIQFTSIDTNGGNWKTYIVSSGTEITVNAPSSPTSTEYLTEITQLQNTTQNATSEQKSKANYWAAGGTMRWHELTREIAVTYNDLPKFNPTTGKYDAPDVNNPSALPKYPFANPDYVSRVFALLAVAQYDAAVTVWNVKMKYMRMAPSTYNSNIKTSVPQNIALPTYPSEDAAIAAASREILKVLFPNEIQYWTKLATEHQQSRLWAGANMQSDIDAGESIGKAIAAKVLLYAKTDGFSGAGNQSNVPAMIADAQSRGTTEIWKSLEIPARPPLLPNLGKVKTWNLTYNDMIINRPPPPPTVNSDEFKQNISELKYYRDHRTQEQIKIANFWADGTSTQTPPGHWNKIACDNVYSHKMNELRAARTMALVSTAIQDAGTACWDAKYYYFLARPTTVDSSITTPIGIPNFPAYTSGHSSFSGAAASVLSYIFPENTNSFIQKAQEAADSRVYACIHFRFDSEEGLKNGKKMGNYAINRGKNDGSD